MCYSFRASIGNHRVDSRAQGPEYIGRDAKVSVRVDGLHDLLNFIFESITQMETWLSWRLSLSAPLLGSQVIRSTSTGSTEHRFPEEVDRSLR